MVSHLTLSLCLAASVQPARAQEHPEPGWLMRSIEKEAARLAANAGPEQAPAGRRGEPTSSWSRVTSLSPATAVVVEVRGLPPAQRHFVWADDIELIVLNLDNPQLPDQVRRTLLEASSTRPENFHRLSEGLRWMHGNVRVTPDGIFLADQKVAETADIVQRIPQADVVAIMTPPFRRGSIVGAVVGAGVGLALGYQAIRRLALKRCGRSCGDETALMALSLVGLPLGGALLGSQLERGTTQRIIYRAAHRGP